MAIGSARNHPTAAGTTAPPHTEVIADPTAASANAKRTGSTGTGHRQAPSGPGALAPKASVDDAWRGALSPANGSKPVLGPVSGTAGCSAVRLPPGPGWLEFTGAGGEP